MTTLIVRDATLAVNGAPETRGDTKAHLEKRTAEVRKMDEESVEACVEVLQAEAGDLGDTTDFEVLLALMILGLAQPEAAARGVGAIAAGRRVAARLEQAGDPESALEVIEVLREVEPGHTALERDWEAIMRRLGMVQDLASRYYDRAQHLLAEGKIDEAVGWFREVLLLDPSRKDVARAIRNLRLGKARGPRKKASFVVLVAIAVPLALAAVGMRERRLSEQYASLPDASDGDLEMMQSRLNSLEAFIEEHPVWHGALGALSERSELRIAVSEVAQTETDARDAAERALADRFDSADLIHARGRLHAKGGDFESALADFREALELAPKDWARRERVETDIDAIAEYLADLASEDEQ